MAFPTTAVLDDFNRANGAIGANWTDKVFGTEPNTLTIDTNASSTSASDIASGWWNVATFGPDCEVYVTTVAFDSDQRLFLNLQSPGSSAVDGYQLSILNTNRLRVFRLDNGVATELGTGDVATLHAGDSYGIDNIGGTLTPRQKTSGVWSAFVSRTDTTYGAGFVGMYNIDGAPFCILDDFGGGTVVAATTLPPLPTVVDAAVARAANY